ncbi:hypothetical protein O4G98_12575 [Zoogloeaceae bacterium G21618-S1]|nr:hypothetical protein [Zoogloeaceae bacterium G21618-S1]
MPELHLIERGQHKENLRCIDKTNKEWESGNWVVSEETAEKLIGGHIFLHKGQDKPSHFGGVILSFHSQKCGQDAGRIAFRFRAGIEFKGIPTDRSGWGNEKKIVW